MPSNHAMKRRIETDALIVKAEAMLAELERVREEADARYRQAWNEAAGQAFNLTESLSKSELVEMCSRMDIDVKSSMNKEDLRNLIADAEADHDEKVQRLSKIKRDLWPHWGVREAIFAVKELHKHKAEFVARLAEDQNTLLSDWDMGAMADAVSKQAEADLWRQVLEIWVEHKKKVTFEDALSYVRHDRAREFDRGGSSSAAHRLFRRTEQDAIGRFIQRTQPAKHYLIDKIHGDGE